MKARFALAAAFLLTSTLGLAVAQTPAAKPAAPARQRRAAGAAAARGDRHLVGADGLRQRQRPRRRGLRHPPGTGQHHQGDDQLRARRGNGRRQGQADRPGDDERERLAHRRRRHRRQLQRLRGQQDRVAGADGKGHGDAVGQRRRDRAGRTCRRQRRRLRRADERLRRAPRHEELALRQCAPACRREGHYSTPATWRCLAAR